jgi:uncharacterized protein YdhG (YjbR/CyaY superfamily)
MKAKPTTIDEYLAPLRGDKRAALEKLRETIKSAVPDAEECISCGLAAFRLHGQPLVAFGASDSHCAFYPMSGSTVGAFKNELKDYPTSKGTIRFQPGKPLPATLVRKLIKARIAENERKPTRQRTPAKKQKSSGKIEDGLPTSLAAPARRALTAAGYTRLEQLRVVSEPELLKLHGMGPRALDQIRTALRRVGHKAKKSQPARRG